MASRSTRIERGERGFTLVELLIALAVVAVLVGMAAPSFQDTLADVQLTAEQNRLVKALRQARSEAIKRVGTVTLCKSDDGTACGGSWSDGWLLFAETGAAGSLGSFDAGDTRIAAHRSTPGKFRSAASATIRPNGAAPVDSISFGARGRADWTLGTLVLCDDRDEAEARAIIVNGAGGLRSQEPDSGTTVNDATGNPVSCPT